ncbi:probable valine--tRNA ligase, cytoplasmic [Diabrotica undecimpunctata]|uniref:probable valine--tRNA ligase, cytoplasmic n=1 Tax=Diabrotica undecimpunctata TaxID=50387 RepID=UPI003B6354DC
MLRILDNKLIFRCKHLNKLCIRRYVINNQKNLELDQAYVPHKVENVTKPNYFKPQQKQSRPFVLVLPPPNITGTLHIGHALTATIQDVLVRWKQMQGFETLWIPGTDHAGIATQVVVEKILWNENKQTRHDIGRELFIEKVHEWRKEKSPIIREQLQRLGVLLDWDREAFTLDEQRSKAVQEAFIKLFEEGLIYRSKSLVNWSCALKSAISDIEVEQLTLTGSTNISVPGYEEPVEFGILTKFAYLIEGTEEEIVVATTRPETMLGDVAIAVHPDDSRYARLIGKFAKHPFRNNTIPIIPDSFVDREFGTGAVKITPAHDFNDYDVGKRHSLQNIQVIDENGKLTFECGKFFGLPRFKARKVITNELQHLGLLRSREEHPMVVPICSRSKDIVEFLIRPQWFLKCDSMAAEAIRNVKEGKLSIDPKMMEKTWFTWLENIRDWCISRQLWWGHQIPAYLCSSSKTEETVWVAAESVEIATQKGASKLGLPASDVNVKRDEDVLDTWFSSALFPFSVFGWPQKTQDLQKYYPISLMETGHDIIFFWVARMVMLGTKLSGQLPFNKICLHGIVCDSQGRKMSKSLGNVIDPQDVIRGVSLEEINTISKSSYEKGILSKEEFERCLQSQKKMFPQGIPECGSDALRFTLVSHNIKNMYINFDVSECYTNKLFCNKIWQATKFTKHWFAEVSGRQELKTVDFDQLTDVDYWILSKLTFMIDKVIDGIEDFDFYICTNALKNFLYFEFCDIYLETTKRGLRSSDNAIALGHLWTLLTCLDVSLRGLAPFMPVLSEHLHSRLPVFPEQEKVLEWPQKLNWRNEHLERTVEDVMDIVIALRRLKKTFNISSKSESKVHLVDSTNRLKKYLNIIEDLTGFKDIRIDGTLPNEVVSTSLKDKSGNTYIYLQVSDEVKKSFQTDLLQIEKKKEKIIKELNKINKMVSGSTYKINASLEKQEIHSKKISSLQEQLVRLEYFQNIAKGS